MSPSQLFPVAIPWRGIHTENSVTRGSGVTLKDTNTPFGSVSTSVIPSRPGWSRTNDPFVWLSPGEKKMGPNQLFLICIWWCIWSWLIWVSVKMLMSLFFSAKLKVPDPASRDLWCHQHCHISCRTIEKSKRKKFLNSVSCFAL